MACELMGTHLGSDFSDLRTSKSETAVPREGDQLTIYSPR